MRGMTAHDVYEDVDRHGNVRTYSWRGKGHRKVRIHEKPGSEEFDKRYHELIRQSADGAFKPAPRDAPKPGTCFKQWDEQRHPARDQAHRGKRCCLNLFAG